MTNGKSDPSRIESQIDENLRRIFEEDVEDELPDRLRQLVDQLDARASGSDDDDDDDDDSGSSGDGGASGRDPADRSDGPVHGAAAAGALRLSRPAPGTGRGAAALPFAKDLS
jgi:hypothetical protein